MRHTAKNGIIDTTAAPFDREPSIRACEPWPPGLKHTAHEKCADRRGVGASDASCVGESPPSAVSGGFFFLRGRSHGEKRGHREKNAFRLVLEGAADAPWRSPPPEDLHHRVRERAQFFRALVEVHWNPEGQLTRELGSGPAGVTNNIPFAIQGDFRNHHHDRSSRSPKGGDA